MEKAQTEQAVPGGEAWQFDDVSVFAVPANGTAYTLETTGRPGLGSGNGVRIAYTNVVSGDELLECFKEVPLAAGQTATLAIGSDAQDVPPLIMPDGSRRPPDDSELIEVISPFVHLPLISKQWSGEAPPLDDEPTKTPTPTPSPTATVSATPSPTASPTASATPNAPGQWEPAGSGAASGGGVSGNSGESTDPHMAAAPDGRLYLAWEDTSAGDSEIYLRRWEGSGWQPLGASAGGGGISDTAGIAKRAWVAFAADGDVYVTWNDNSSGNDEIYVRRWDGSGWVAAGSGAASGGGISRTAGESRAPRMAFSGNTPTVCWADDTTGDWEIYVRRLENGTWKELGGSAGGGGISDNSSLSAPARSRSAATAIRRSRGAIRARETRRSTRGAGRDPLGRRWAALPAGVFRARTATAPPRVSVMRPTAVPI